MKRTILIAVFGAALFAGYGADARRKEDKPRNAEVIKQGKVQVVRGLRGPEPQLADDKGNRWQIIGPVMEETLRLDSHTLKVWGVIGAKQSMLPTLDVKRYEILDTGGSRPLVGKLRRENRGKYTLARSKDGNLEIVANRGFRRRLKRRVGCKIWILGDLQGSTLKAHKFGWISCNPPKALKPRKERSQ